MAETKPKVSVPSSSGIGLKLKVAAHHELDAPVSVPSSSGIGLKLVALDDNTVSVSQ